MVAMRPPPLSFTSLNFLLRTASTSPDDAEMALSDHKDTLFRAVDASKPEQGIKQETKDILYRSGAATTQSHPVPTAAELSCIESTEKGLGISRCEAAVLLRDYLDESKGNGVADVLDHCSDLMDIAPIDALEVFWVREKRNAYSCLVTVCAGASQRSTHPYYGTFSSFLSKNGVDLKRIILRGAVSALTAYDERGRGVGRGTASGGESWWFFELLFSYCLYDVLNTAEREQLLQTYLELAKKSRGSSGNPTAESGRLTSHLDGSEATALFAASLNLSNGLAAIVHAEKEAMEAMDMETNDEERLQKLASLAGETEAVERIDGVVTSLRGYQSAEVSMLSFSWAAFLRLRRWLIEGEEEEEPDESRQGDAVGHMSSAVACNVFGTLRSFAHAQLRVDELIIGELYQCFWVDVEAFLTAFPPQNFNPAQVEDVVNLSTSLLSGTDHGTWVDTAESIWDREDIDSPSATGANSLLRLASAVFPQSFRPLISLLSALTLSQNSAERAADFLQNQLETLTEHSEGYQYALLVLDQEEDSQILESLSAGRGPQFERILRNLSAVCPDDEDIVYVQAGEDIPPDMYRPVISRGTLGISNRSLTAVTWITAWDGFGAVDYILRVLLRLLREHEASSMYEEVVLNELLLSALDCLKFVDRLYRTGSKALRGDLAQCEERLSVVSGIVAELADPGDWARGSWLTKKRREVLLTVSASCIASITMDSSSRARRALEHMSSSKNALPLQAALSALGANAFPAVAAVSRVAGLCSHGDVLSETLMRKLSLLARSSDGHVAGDSFQGLRGDANMVYKFLRGVALPLWLTTSVMVDADPETKSLHWLLPACSLHLFSKRPSDVLSDPAISAVITAVITGAVGSGSDYRSQTESTDTFLFPALRAALVACYEALSQRNASLQETNNDDMAISFRNEPKASPGSESTADLTTLEKLLLKPDVIHAMAVMSSGCAEGLGRRKFFSMWAASEFRGFLPDSEPDRYLYWNVTGRDARAETICSWKEWVEDMCARCLSLQFCCLSQMSEKGDIIQVPWPTMDRSSFGYWRGGGEWIRKGYADRITKDRSVATTELLVTVLSCGQRAAARSLMGPHAKKTESGGDGPDSKCRPTNTELPNEQKATTGGSYATRSRDQSHGAADQRNEILCAVVSFLSESRDGWVKAISEPDALDETNSTAVVRDLGQKSLAIAACVRFLRVGWESHSSKWFRKCWTELKTWDLLASLLRCDGGNARSESKLDLANAVDSPHDFLSSGVTRSLSEMLRAFSINNVVLKQSLSIDIVTAWKSIAADCLHVFAFEISIRTSEALVLPQSAPNPTEEQTEQKEKKVSLDVFKGEPFAQFASVFTERWMHVLLNVDENYLTGCALSKGDSLENSTGTPVVSFTQKSDDIRSIEDRTRSLSMSLGKAIGLNELQAEQSRLLNDFRRAGDVRIRFGTDYAFDVPAILSFMKALEVNVAQHKDLIIEALLLNAELNRKDVQVEVVTAFSEMASGVLFADSFAPTQSVALTYSSPQFAGKLCRFLSRVLVCMMPSAARSSHTITISAEIARLMASLSANLSSDELQQPALTSMRFSQPPVCAQQECSLSPLAQICVSVNRTLSCVQARLEDSIMDITRLDTARWLLLTAARLAAGASFRSPSDFETLAKCATDTLKLGRPVANLYAAASVAICSVLEGGADASIRSPFDDSAVESVFAAVSALARNSLEKPKKTASCRAAASLLLAVARLHLTKVGEHETRQSRILRYLSGGSVLAFLPSSNNPIPTYEANLDSRHSAHLVWCASLRLSGSVIPDEIHCGQSAADRDQGLRDVLEFCATNLLRISRDSLDLAGDWPTVLLPSSEESQGHDRPHVQRYLTIGRIEEAEAACVAVFKLANYALQLEEALPELLHKTILELIRFIYQVYKVIRAEPVERSVRPVTQREKERSQLLRNDRDSAGSHTHFGYSPLPWAMSPSKTGTNTSTTPPRRSPSQALRAAIGGIGGSRNSPGSFVPPSPGMPMTPQHNSPKIGGAVAQNSHYPSPGSPWGPYGSGLITDADLYFGEEASRSLLRALSFALGALRRFADVMDMMLFKPTMVMSEENIGLGVLVALQYHACSEVYRGAQESRRKSLQDIIDNALHLTMTHVVAYNEQGLLTQGVKDELRKRIATVRSRMQKVAPPAPSYSVVHSQELETFLYQLKGAP